MGREQISRIWFCIFLLTWKRIGGTIICRGGVEKKMNKFWCEVCVFVCFVCQAYNRQGQKGHGDLCKRVHNFPFLFLLLLVVFVAGESLLVVFGKPAALHFYYLFQIFFFQILPGERKKKKKGAGERLGNPRVSPCTQTAKITMRTDESPLFGEKAKNGIGRETFF